MRARNRNAGGMNMLDMLFYVVTVVVIIDVLMKMEKRKDNDKEQ